MKAETKPNLTPHPAWNDVRYSMPDDEITVLVCADGEVCLAWHEESVWRDCCTGALIHCVSHWMHLPEPPETL